MSEQALRWSAGLALGFVLLGGVMLSGKQISDSRRRVDELRGHTVTVEQAQARLDARAMTDRFDTQAYLGAVQSDARAFEIEAPSLERLLAPAPHTDELDEPVVLGPGKSWSSEHLRITAVVDKVAYQQHGATISAPHVIARIENIGRQPIAYFVQLRSAERGHCEARGARMHNAIALMPKEVAEQVVCAGRGRLRVENVEVLEITELGYHYLGQVPADAVGHDSITAAAHNPLRRTRPCSSVDGRELGGFIRSGSVRWVDVVDFFARHNCERYGFAVGYRHIAVPLVQLPVAPTTSG